MQPTDWAVPKISLMVLYLESSVAKDRYHICQAMLSLIKSDISIVLNAFSFFLFLGGSLRALMIGAEAEGTSSAWACVF